MLRHSLVLVAAAMLAAGCNGPDDSTVDSGLTAEEASQLNDAAAMLDASASPPMPANSLAP